MNGSLVRDRSTARILCLILPLLYDFTKDLFPMQSHMLLFIDVRPDAFGQQTKRFEACTSDSFGTGLLQILSPLVTMRPTAGRKVELEGIVGGHGVRGVDPGGTKKVVSVTLVSAEKFDAGESCANAPHASHVQHTLTQ